MASQSRRASSGPFTPRSAIATAKARAVICVQLALRFRCFDIEASKAHLVHVSTLAGPGIRPYPASYAGAADGGRSCGTRFPVSFRPPALASWTILFPLRDWAFLTVGLPDPISVGTPAGVATFHTRETRPGWAPSLSRDGGALPLGPDPLRHLPLLSGQSCSPPLHPI